MAPPVFLHLLAASVWLGCVLTEAIGERGGDATPELRRFISEAHARWDFFVEAPAFLVVAATGAWMLRDARLDLLLAGKIALGVVALLANVWCVGIVLRRREAARTDDWTKWRGLDDLQHKVGAVVLGALLGALILGTLRLSA